MLGRQSHAYPLLTPQSAAQRMGLGPGTLSYWDKKPSQSALNWPHEGLSFPVSDSMNKQGCHMAVGQSHYFICLLWEVDSPSAPTQNGYLWASSPALAAEWALLETGDWCRLLGWILSCFFSVWVEHCSIQACAVFSLASPLPRYNGQNARVSILSDR